MNITSRSSSRARLHIASVSFALAIAGCYDKYEAPAEQTETPSSGGSVTASGGATSSGGSATKGEESGGSDPGTGGTTDVSSEGGTTATGGTATATGGTKGDEEGGNPSTGGAPEIDTGGSTSTGGKNATGGKSATGGAPSQGGSASGGVQATTGGVQATGGTTATGGVQATGGTTATGGAPQGGSGGGPVVEESICVDESGAPVPYDFSFGIASEYAFELSMSCEVGGYLMPLVLADPEQLSHVNGFVLEATDWYRANILNCPDESSALGKDKYGLLPASESSDLSAEDFEASLSLFMAVVDRHDDQPDAVSANKKDKIKKRIKSVKTKAVHNNAAGLTKTLPETECVPAAPAEGGG